MNHAIAITRRHRIYLNRQFEPRFLTQLLTTVKFEQTSGINFRTTDVGKDEWINEIIPESCIKRHSLKLPT